MTTSDTNPRPPAGLGPTGRTYWTKVVADYVLNVDELVLLRQTCAVLDEIAAFDRRIAADGLVVVGSQGQPRPNPLVSQRRASRSLLARLVSQLGLPAADGGRVRTGLEARAASGHRKRWGDRPADEVAARRARGNAS